MARHSEYVGSENPFAFDRPLEDAGALIGRDTELTELAKAIQPGSDVLVEGPHRHGKTSLVNVGLRASAGREHGLAVTIDCAGVLIGTDFVRNVEEAYAHCWAEGAVEQALVERLEALPFRLVGQGATNTAARLEALLDVAAGVAEASGTGALVAFDEVQDIFGIPDIVDALGTVRGRSGDRLSYVFVGPQLPTTDHGLWREHASTVSVGTIDPVLFAGEIMHRFADTGRDAGEAAKVIATVGAGHPQRSSLLASQLWELTGERERATVATARAAIEQALVRCAPEFDVRWSALHSNERRVAVAIANEIAPQGTRAQRATGLASFGAAQRALQGIKTSGVAQTRDERTTLADPLFAEWLRRRYSQIPVEPDWQALRRRAELQRGGITRGM